MNDLQLTLLMVGGGGIVGMIAYNWWQDYRLRKQANERFGTNGEDPLLGQAADRAEPGLRGEPSLQGVSPIGHDGEPVPAPAPDKRLFTDIYLRFEQPLSTDEVATLAGSLSHVNRKRLLYAACIEEVVDQESHWCQVHTLQSPVKAVRVSLQLANRNGALSSIEFSEVISKLRHFAESHHGELEFAEMKDVMLKSETLDQAAAALDTLLGLHCLLPEQVEEGSVADWLQAAGWQHRGHQWQFLDSEQVLVSMVIHNAPAKRLLSFNIDVPNSPDPVRALAEVVTFCHKLNSEHGAPMMDDAGRTLSTEAIEGIYDQLQERIRNLTDSGFTPGSDAARVLFS